MGVIGAIKKGFGVAAKGLGLISVLFVFNLVGSLLSLPFTATPGAAPEAGQAVGALVFSFIFILISIFIQGGTMGLVRDALKTGSMKLAEMPKYGLKYYLKLLLLGLIIVLFILIIGLIVAALIAVTAPLNNPAVTASAVAIAAIIALVVGILYFVPFTLSPYAIVCDDAGVIEALKKSLKIAKKPLARLLTMILLIVVLVLIAMGIGFVIGFLMGLIAAVLPAGVGRIVMIVATSLVNGYIGVVITGSFVAFYLSITGKEASVGEKVF